MTRPDNLHLAILVEDAVDVRKLRGDARVLLDEPLLVFPELFQLIVRVAAFERFERGFLRGL